VKRERLWLLLIVATSYIQAAFIDIYKPVGDEKQCKRTIFSILDRAYHHYPSITASEKLLLSAKAQIESAKWNYFPTPSIDFSQGSAGRRGETYRIDQPLWTGGKLDALSELAYARGDEAKYTLGESSYDLATKVLSVLEAFIQADGEVKAFKKGKKDLEDLAGMLNRRVKAGVSSESDEELIRSRIYQIEGDLMTAERHYEMAKSQLELLTGQKFRCGVSFKHDPHLKEKPSFERLETKMLRTHPTLKKAAAQVAIAKAERKNADAVVMPNISLRAEHQRGSLYTNDPVNNETIAYVAVSFNPGAGLSAMSDMESAKYKMMQALDEQRTREQELKDILVRDYADYSAALQRVESVQHMIISSEKVLESYKRLFLAGKRQWLDLVNSSREVTMNYVTLASLRATLIISAYKLSLEAGELHFENKGR
jgi:adhesin transport system outer membrane protein